MWLSLLISVAFVPGWTGAAIPTGWAAMSFLLPWVMLKDVTMTSFHYLGLTFLAYAALSLAWTSVPLDGIGELWHWSLIALAFMWASRQERLTPFWKGLAIGCGISSVVAIGQWIGVDTILTLDWNKPAGLFYNNAIAGSTAAITVVGLMSVGLWRWVPLTFPLLLLSHSRGAWVALAGTWAVVAFNAFKGKEKLVFAAILAAIAAVAYYFLQGASDSLRLAVWSHVAQHLSIFGAGVGSATNIYMFTPNEIFHIDHAHNDYLNLLYEYGLGALPLFALALWLVEQTDEYAWPPLVCCLILSLYYWTLEAPTTAFAFAVVAVHVASNARVAWDHILGSRLNVLSRNASQRLRFNAENRGNLPV